MVGKKTNLILAVSVIGLIGVLLPNQTPDPAPTQITESASPTASANQASPTPDQSADVSTSSAPTETSTPAPEKTETPEETATPANEPSSLQELIGQLVIAAEQGAGYDRDLFRHWIDADGDGCNTRKEVLIAEAKVKPTVTGDCDLVGGEWYSVYDQVNTTDPSSFDIDHFIPLKEAWDSGAHAWSSDKRKEFANDLGFGGSLIAVTASSNRSKSDRDPADWMPANNGYHCTYITNWVEVKIRWGLSVDDSEYAVLKDFSSTCK
jgi:hypothetical protein